MYKILDATKTNWPLRCAFSSSVQPFLSITSFFLSSKKLKNQSSTTQSDRNRSSLLSRTRLVEFDGAFAGLHALAVQMLLAVSQFGAIVDRWRRVLYRRRFRKSLSASAVFFFSLNFNCFCGRVISFCWHFSALKSDCCGDTLMLYVEGVSCVCDFGFDDLPWMGTSSDFVSFFSWIKVE